VASQFAYRLSLIAFTTTTVRGLLSGADFYGTIQAALLALAVFYAAGLLMGELARRVVEESVDAEIARNIAASSQQTTGSA
jgi:hypothetical protein